jgi:hypothetical protein
VADRIGIFAVHLFSKDDDARRFYLKYGFISLQDDPLHLYVLMATVRGMFVEAGESVVVVRLRQNDRQ